jgi:hypothetical protein
MLRRRRPTRSWRLHLDLNSVFGYAFDIYPSTDIRWLMRVGTAATIKDDATIGRLPPQLWI